MKSTILTTFFLVAILLASTLTSKGQKGTGAAASPYASTDKWSEWSAYASNNCYEGIKFRVKTNRTSQGLMEVLVEFDNAYKDKLSFNCTVRAGRTNGGNRFTISGRSTQTWSAGYFTSETVYIDFERVRLGDDYGDYIACDK